MQTYFPNAFLRFFICHWPPHPFAEDTNVFLHGYGAKESKIIFLHM